MSLQQTGVAAHVHKALAELHDLKMVIGDHPSLDMAIGQLMGAMNLYHDAGASQEEKQQFAAAMSDEIADKINEASHHETWRVQIIIRDIINAWEKYKPKIN